MKLSTKGRYGVKAMLDLALHSECAPVSIKSIAQRQAISDNYLEQLFSVLRKSGHIKSIRGSQGGYVLSSKPEDITVGSILRALEGSLAPVECVVEDQPLTCDRYNICVTKTIWAKIRDKINDVVDSITLSDLVEECMKNKNNGDFIFFI
ncbi:UNVERIFIED_CONTAM: BadM/Rrf2 family transcriptional regulator [Acetivibrio alkalicellulosi]